METAMAALEGDLNAAAVAQHQTWLVGSQLSAKRLVVSNKRYEGTDFQVWQLNGVGIEDCHFRQVDFRYAMLQESALVRSEFRQTLFFSCRMQSASWVDLYMEDCNFNLARLNSVTAQGCTMAD